ncbi:hypothetical protein GPECTOR_67g268 [Gonium pectorale]|uniref:Uncharacterized protein n=1 Tax=Gonium pectorale TaxID=33097 RepID=A0A150G3M1_GONPE|nr:hypothetical protein GPECTOR_67g268 [Gonium pectorale]|eukprot:KXZ44428.1 hypothetical protein GPECTOR_67g268 [Gonium pectorale]
MAYNLYQVQMAKAWAERIEKENAQSEKFWHEQSLKQGQTPLTAGLTPIPASTQHAYTEAHEVRSVAGTAARSAAPTGFTSKTSYLKSRMEKLEAELTAERESRKKVEEDLAQLRSSLRH